MKKLTWREVNPAESKISLRTSPIVIDGFHAFRSTGLRWIDLELHDNSVPLSEAFKEKMFHLRIRSLLDRIVISFPGIHAFNISICHSHSSSNQFCRQILDNLHYVILSTSSTCYLIALLLREVRSVWHHRRGEQHPFPALTLPFCNGEWSTFNYKENITIDVITPRLCAGIVRLGEEARAGDEHRILSSLSLESSRNFALTYCTNMTTARISKAHAILAILNPLLKKKSWKDVIVHLQSVEMCLFPCDLMRMADSWCQLRYLDLRFNVIRRYSTDVPTVETVQMLTVTCRLLEYLFLPELSITGFRNNGRRIHTCGLHTLSSSVLICDNDDTSLIARALLDAYPTLAKVKLDVSAVGWTPISEVLHNLRYQSDRIHHWVATTAINRAHSVVQVVREVSRSLFTLQV